MLFKLAILLSLILTIFFHRNQNQPGKIGGPIALSKSFWLHYTITTWFLLLPYALWMLPDAPPADRLVWWILTLSMWTRGIVELIMLFITKNWTPIIGISHDVLTFFAMAVGYATRVDEAAGKGSTAAGVFSPVNLSTTLFTFSLLLSMGVETHHAASFYRLMRGRTQGDEGLWYAHPGDPRFTRILRVTTFFNGVLYSAIAFFLFDKLL